MAAVEPLAAQSERAAAAIIAEMGTGGLPYDALVALVAYAWREGAIAGLDRGKEIVLDTMREGQPS